MEQLLRDPTLKQNHISPDENQESEFARRSLRPWTTTGAPPPPPPKMFSSVHG